MHFTSLHLVYLYVITPSVQFKSAFAEMSGVIYADGEILCTFELVAKSMLRTLIFDYAFVLNTRLLYNILFKS